MNFILEESKYQLRVVMMVAMMETKMTIWKMIMENKVMMMNMSRRIFNNTQLQLQHIIINKHIQTVKLTYELKIADDFYVL